MGGGLSSGFRGGVKLNLKIFNNPRLNISFIVTQSANSPLIEQNFFPILLITRIFNKMNKILHIFDLFCPKKLKNSPKNF